MPIKVQCNSCGKVYQIADALAGKKVKCKNCGAVFPIPNPDEEFGEIDNTSRRTLRSTHYSQEQILGRWFPPEPRKPTRRAREP